MKEIYNKLFSRSYSSQNHSYNKLVVDFANKVGGSMLDAGCGRGYAARMMIEAGHDVFAIDFSKVCCENYLGDIPHECADIVTHCNNNTYGGIVCMGVLEHIPPEDIEETIEALAESADSALIAIANHSDIQMDVELHTIQEDEEWWEAALLQYYDECKVISRFRDRLFVFECHIKAEDEE